MTARLALCFCDPDIICLEGVPYLGRQSVDKFSTEFDGCLENWISLREHAAADAVARFDDGH